MNKFWDILISIQSILIFVLQTFIPTYLIFVILVGSISMFTGLETVLPYDIFKIGGATMPVFYISTLIIPLITLFLLIQKFFFTKGGYSNSKSFVIFFYIVALSSIAIISHFKKLSLLHYEVLSIVELIMLYVIDIFLFRKSIGFHFSDIQLTKYLKSLRLLLIKSIPIFILLLTTISIITQEHNLIMTALALIPYYVVLILIPLAVLLSIVYLTNMSYIITILNQRQNAFFMVSFSVAIGTSLLDTTIIPEVNYGWIGMIINSLVLLFPVLIIQFVKRRNFS